MTNRTADEARTNYIEKMGQPLGTQYPPALLQKVAALHMVWGEFVELFRDEPRVDVLNRTAPAMFHIIGHALWELTLLDIARLTDPPISAGKKNLTIRNLPELVKPEVRADVQKLVDAALERSDVLRDHRNRQLAHLDLDLLTDQSAKPLEAATMKMVDEADRRYRYRAKGSAPSLRWRAAFFAQCWLCGECAIASATPSTWVDSAGEEAPPYVTN